jgi:PAS domain S-box-containing protein
MQNQTDLIDELKVQKSIAYTAGLLQGDVTIKTLLESLAEGVIFINESGRIILINDRLSEMTGYDKHEIMGQHMNLFIPDKWHKTHNSHIKDYFKEPRIRPMGTGLELSAKRKDNSTFMVDLSISFLNTDSGRLGIGFITDITARKEAEHELKKRNLELDAYAHTVAHDLNSSLTGIVGFSELLINPDYEFSKEEHDSYLKEIAQGSRKMTSIIKELLLFASMKKEEVDVGEINMKETLDSACHRLKYQIKEKNAQIEISENILNCTGYSLWVEEIWLNYISNAIKYGGTPPKIKIYSSKTKNGYIKYSVEDEGEGIKSELKEIIFNIQDKNKDKLTKGFGLGLSIVKRIIEKLDGHLSIESEEGKGSVFSFYLKELC